MKLRYENTADDAVAAAMHHYDTSSQDRRLRAFIQGGLPVLMFIVVALTVRNKVGIAAAAIAATTYFVRVPMMMRRAAERQVRKQYAKGAPRALLGWHEIELTPDLLIDRCEAGETRVPLRGVQRVASARDHVLIYLTAESALAIPRRAAEPGLLEQLVAAIESVKHGNTSHDVVQG